MKKNLFILCLCFCFCITEANTQSLKQNFNISLGGGFQHYKGDLGSSFLEVKDACWYGSVNLNLSVKLTKSFDAGIFLAKGDYGYCQPKEMRDQIVAEDLRCTGCKDRLGMGNLSSRMSSAGVLVKYKFANNYILKESSLFKPYLFVGIGYNKLVDIMKRDCVNEGNYISYNGGFGVTYDITNRINLSYNLNFGYFNSDKIDLINDGTNDAFMQNTFLLGFNF
ncbi:MAG: outer membrane beta-barrel protein [Bacteroidota bacterium]